MMFAIKLSKGQIELAKCPYVDDDLKEKIEYSNKIQQKEITLGKLKIGGETVMYRHEKTFVNPTIFAIELDCNDLDFDKKLNEVLKFEIECVGKKYKVDAVYLKNPKNNVVDLIKKSGIEVIDDAFLLQLMQVEFTTLEKTVNELTKIRQEAILNRNQEFSNPVYVKPICNDIFTLCGVCSTLICKYANLLILDKFSPELLSALITLRLNIYTDPQKPLQVESKVYEFNNPDENALVFLTTNFALSYFAVANELSSLKCGSYLVITPSEGMSVLTAWSAQKITADIASKVVSASEILDKVKVKKLIIPGLLVDLKDELQSQLNDWEIVVGTTEAYKIPEFVKKFSSNNY